MSLPLDETPLAATAPPFALGREEWVALPALGLPAIKAKVDTGAGTSALHAVQIVPFDNDGTPYVRFSVRPVPGREEPVITCIAPIVARRRITSSSGERELRYVIATEIAVGGRTWPIEVTLTNREGMRFRMLLGRQALQDDMLVQPASAHLQPELGHDVYGAHARGVAGTLRIALLTRRPSAASNRRLFEAAIARGHLMEPIDPDWCVIELDPARPGVRLDSGAPVRFDTVIARLGRSPAAHAIAVLRRLEAMGATVVNRPEAIEAAREPVLVLERLAAAGLRTAYGSIARGELVRDEDAGVRCVRAGLVVGGRAIAGLERAAGDHASPAELEPEERRLAGQAARTLGLGFAEVELVATRAGPAVLDVNSAPRLTSYRAKGRATLSDRIIAHLEQERLGA